LEELGIDRMKILKRHYRNRFGWSGLNSYGSSEKPVAGSCEYGNEPSGSIKGGKFLDYLSVLQASPGLCSMELIIMNGVTKKCKM
jgi:hypothetical protein